MNCFNHRELAAVGICKSCGKALCPDCVAEVDGTVSCGGKCEEKVKDFQAFGNPSAILSTSNSAMRGWALLTLAIGLTFVAFGMWQASLGDVFLSYFLSIAGGIFLIGGIMRFRRSAQYAVPKTKKEN